MQTQLVKISGNGKTGPIPVSTTERDSCHPSCAFYLKGCYAKTGPISWNWKKVLPGMRGTSYGEFIKLIKALPAAQVWRHNASGDLATTAPQSGVIDAPKLKALTRANKNKRGFTYTHHPRSVDNLRALHEANRGGFTVNLSTDRAIEVADAMATGLPTVTVLPLDAPKVQVVNGAKIVRCPATNEGSTLQCARCAPTMCGKADRTFAIGFPAHGNSAKTVDLIASAA